MASVSNSMTRAHISLNRQQNSQSGERHAQRAKVAVDSIVIYVAAEVMPFQNGAPIVIFLAQVANRR